MLCWLFERWIASPSVIAVEAFPCCVAGVLVPGVRGFWADKTPQAND